MVPHSSSLMSGLLASSKTHIPLLTRVGYQTQTHQTDKFQELWPRTIGHNKNEHQQNKKEFRTCASRSLAFGVVKAEKNDDEVSLQEQETL